MNCVQAREKLTSSIRLQWKKLKSHVERLDSQGNFGASILLSLHFYKTEEVEHLSNQLKCEF